MTVLVTGAAGFIGSHVVADFRRTGTQVVAVDVVGVDDAVRLGNLRDDKGVRYIAGDLTAVIPEAMEGVDEVWHFAANADIPLGSRNTLIDIEQSIMSTRSVLESMLHCNLTRLVYPSTSGVYGDNPAPSLQETSGPLLPTSMYAAGKLGAEGLISAYCSTFGIRATIFRLGNVVGGAMGRGIVRDFVHKLAEDPTTLNVLGDGRQRKSYVLVDDVISAIRHISRKAEERNFKCDVYNIAAGESVATPEIASIVASVMQLATPNLTFGASTLSWAGDQPVVELDITKALSTGWQPTHTAHESIRIAAERILRQEPVVAP